MNRRTLRATGIVLTGLLLAGDPVSMIYAAPVAGLSVATTAEAVAVGTGSSSPSAGVSLAVADCLVASNEEVAQEAAAQQEQVSENETPVVESEYADIAIAQVDNYVNVRTEPNTESEVVGKLYNNSAATILQTTEDGWYEITSGISLRLQLVPDVGLDAVRKVIGKLMHTGGDLMSQRLHGE